MMKVISLAVLAGVICGSWAQEEVFNFTSPIFPNPQVLDPLISGFECHRPTNLQCWTQWFETDSPSRMEDMENLAKLIRRHPGQICPDPLDIEARTLSGLTPEEAGDIIKITDRGFICRKRDQPDRECEDYKVRFSCPLSYCGDIVCWTNWYDRDDPSVTSDWESLEDLQSENPGDICKEPLYIETVTTHTLAPAIYTGENFFVCNSAAGLVCRQKDQMSRTCRNHKVRFGCPCRY